MIKVCVGLQNSSELKASYIIMYNSICGLAITSGFDKYVQFSLIYKFLKLH